MRYSRLPGQLAWFIGALAGALAGLPGCDTDNDAAQSASSPAVQPAEPPAATPRDREESPAVSTPQPPSPVAPSVPQVTTPGQSPPASTFRPLGDAQVGEWCEYAAHQQRTVRYEVIALDVAAVQVLISVTQDGKPLGLPAIREENPAADPFVPKGPKAGGQRTTRRESVQVAGRAWQATCHEDRWTEEGVAYVEKTWISDQAPVYGLLKMIKTGDGTVEASMELRAFGVEGR